MKLNAFWKGLIMALIGFVATTISDLETFNAAYVGISTVSFTLIYVAKNYVWESKSKILGLDWQDLLSGLILALGMGISSYVAQILTIGFEWQSLWVAVSGAVIGYFTKTFSSKK
jgi:hypothetical protein